MWKIVSFDIKVQTNTICSTVTCVLNPCLTVFFPLESQNLPKQPPLMLALGQATECVQLMARVRSGSCSFARVDNFLH